MARYCFYCGRELATNEKCNCRTHAGTASATDNPKKQTEKPPKQAARPTARKPLRKPAWNKAALMAAFQNTLRYFARPVDTIRQSVQAADSKRFLTLLLLHAALGGVSALLLSQLGTLDLLLQLTIAGSANNPTLAAVFMGIQGFGLTLVYDLILVVVTLLSLRYVFRADYTFIRVAGSLTPVIFYSILFTILALFSLSAVPISSLMTLAAGLAVSAIALYLALRQLTNYEENRCFMLTVFILLIYTSLIAMLLSLASPAINVLLDQTLPL